MKKIAVVTTTRAEYGLLSPVIKELREYESGEFRVELVVTGTHLSPEHGRTLDEIDDRIDKIISIPVKSDSYNDISYNQAVTLIQFTELFVKEKYDSIILLGDRYETLAIAIAAGNTLTPIFHLCGGDTTEGAIDEWIRHAITKISYLHFVTNETSRKRVIQLGEDPNRVFNYGSTSIDNIIKLANTSKQEALLSIGLEDCEYALCTYQPVTMVDDSVEEQIRQLIAAIKNFPNIEFVITKANADKGGSVINLLLDDADKTVSNMHVFSSLGFKRYLSLMRHAEFVLGNSSSGIIEAPALHVPTINIGDRQKGRLQSESIINCGINEYDITNAIIIASSDKHKMICKNVKSKYGDGSASVQIAKQVVKTVTEEGQIDLKKPFYNIYS